MLLSSRVLNLSFMSFLMTQQFAAFQGAQRSAWRIQQSIERLVSLRHAEVNDRDRSRFINFKLALTALKLVLAPHK